MSTASAALLAQRHPGRVAANPVHPLRLPRLRRLRAAIADDGAAINQCPAGGAEGVARLSAITGQPVTALNPVNGTEGPRGVAVIDEAWCIGCTLCLDACPTDAILAATSACTPSSSRTAPAASCASRSAPVDCITMENVTGSATGWAAWPQHMADQARERYAFSLQRRERAEAEQQQKLQAKAEAKLADLEGHSRLTDPAELDKKRAVIEAALARARAKRAGG